MKKIILTVLVIATTAVSCQKDKFNTKPTLEFKSSNATVFQKGQLIEFVLRYTDKEGDIQKNIYLEEVTKVNCADNNFNTLYAIPQNLPEKPNSEGEILIQYIYGINSPTGRPPTYPGAGCQKNDTCFFRFALTDKADNTSDTITSPQIVFVY